VHISIVGLGETEELHSYDLDTYLQMTKIINHCSVCVPVPVFLYEYDFLFQVCTWTRSMKQEIIIYWIRQGSDNAGRATMYSIYSNPFPNVDILLIYQVWYYFLWIKYPVESSEIFSNYALYISCTRRHIYDIYMRLASIGFTVCILAIRYQVQYLGNAALHIAGKVIKACYCIMKWLQWGSYWF